MVPKHETDRAGCSLSYRCSANSGAVRLSDKVKKEREDIQMDERSVTRDPKSEDENVDGCEVEIENPTPDEDLPAAEGGVA